VPGQLERARPNTYLFSLEEGMAETLLGCDPVLGIHYKELGNLKIYTKYTTYSIVITE